ncbi:hypothetical protein [Acinetobacter junii]|uniref:hypothetical protein n=1 Tax=Acinetobacter junii TaxID=40215 RepID=UPI0034CEE0B4
MNQKKYFLINIIFSILLVYFLYYKVVYYDYIWDDFILFVNNTSLANQELTWNIISRPVLEGSAYFRPLVFFTWFLEFKIFGQDPFYSHLFNIIIFYLNALMTFFLANKLFNNRYLASFVLLFYLVNPILIESTVWISGRFDLLASFFTLLALNIYLNFNYKSYPISLSIVILFFLGLLSKEIVVIFPFILFCFWAYKENLVFNDLNKYKRFIIDNKFIIFFIIIFYGVYFFLRKDAIGVIGSTTYNVVKISELFEFFVPLQAFSFYIKNFLFPVYFIKPINPLDYSLNWEEKFKYLFNFLFIILCIGILFLKKIKEVWMVIAIIISISLVLYIIPFNNGVNVGNMRFMTLGVSFYSIFFVALLNLIFNKIKLMKNKRFGFVIFFTFIVCFLFAIILNFKQSIKIWENEFTLWKSAYLIDPKDETSKYNYLNALILKGDFKKVKDILDSNEKGMSGAEQALYAHSLLNMRDKEGILYYQGLIESLPKYHERYNSINDINNLRIFSEIGLTTQALAAIYKNYAMALLLFNNDFEKSTHYQNIAKWYYSSNETLDILNDEFILKYLSGDHYQANLLYNKIKKTKSVKEIDNRNIISNFINQYCSEFNKINSSCKTWESDKEKYLFL